MWKNFEEDCKHKNKTETNRNLQSETSAWWSLRYTIKQTFYAKNEERILYLAMSYAKRACVRACNSIILEWIKIN